MFSQKGRGSGDGMGQILAGLGSMMAGQGAGGGGGGGGGGIDLSLVGDIISGISSMTSGAQKTKRSTKQHQHSSGEEDESSGGGFDFEGMLNIASAFMGQSGNAEGVMGLLPLVLDTFSGGGGKSGDRHDHSDHSWFMPPILENAHLMWDHFRFVFVYYSYFLR